MYWYTSMIVAKFWFISDCTIAPRYIMPIGRQNKNVISECAIHWGYWKLKDDSLQVNVSYYSHYKFFK